MAVAPALVVAVMLLTVACRPSTDQGSALQERINAQNDPRLVKTPGQAPLVGVFAQLPRKGNAPVWSSPDFPYSREGIAAEDGDLSPAAKYDLAFDQGSQATAWEKQHHGTDGGHAELQSWFGHCNGAAAAIVTTPEPQRSVTKNGVTFTTHDLKALLTEVNYQAETGIAGVRCNDSDASVDADGRPTVEACRDMNAGSFHVVVANLLGREGRMPIIDIDRGPAIWNAPIFDFKVAEATDISAQEANDLVSRGRNTSAGYAYNDLAKSFVKVKMDILYMYITKRSYSYDYILELNQAGKIIGGEWIGDSREHHPDFIWFPVSPASANPFIEFAQVKALVRKSF